MRSAMHGESWPSGSACEVSSAWPPPSSGKTPERGGCERSARDGIQVGPAGIAGLAAGGFGALARGEEQHAVWMLVGFEGTSEEHTSELQSLAYIVCRLL